MVWGPLLPSPNSSNSGQGWWIQGEGSQLDVNVGDNNVQFRQGAKCPKPSFIAILGQFHHGYAPQDEKTNLHQICLVQICCKYEICKALQPVQRWQWPNLHKNGQIRPLPPLHWLQSFANFIFATYLHQANLGQVQFFIQCSLFKATMLNTVFKHGLVIVVLCRSGQGKCLPCRSLGFESRRRLFYTFESKFFFLSFFLYN